LINKDILLPELTIIGGGLAGSEAAWQAAERGILVRLYEMRPRQLTPAHTTGYLAELVCSNSMGSNLIDRGTGLLQDELRRMHSLLLECAQATALPAGGSLAVDREQFAALVTQKISNHPNIQVIPEEVKQIPGGPVIIASGPLTSPSLSTAIQELTGLEHLFFYDAIAPVVAADSINMHVAFRASRFERGSREEGDYINCPMEVDQYTAFITELCQAKRIELRQFELDLLKGVTGGAGKYFEGCLPVEILAQRGPETLAFGPLRPIGLADPRTGKFAFAVLQLRQDNQAGSLYNLVGFQTNLTFPEQKRVLRMVPGLEHAEFMRYGQMHRNTFIASPLLLRPTLQFIQRDDLFFAGQITGVEGYMGNIATGLLAGVNAARVIKGLPALALPPLTMLGALCQYITHAEMKYFQPMKANFGILPIVDRKIRGSRERAMVHVNRAVPDLDNFIENESFFV
jgi:methylenetetrahydrofolate--tRNA-(uracil-5-)-methyltransferase